MTRNALMNECGARLVPAIISAWECLRWLCLVAVLFMVPTTVRADRVVLQNGDCYYGQVLSLTANVLLLQSDVLGKVTLPRSRVTHITLGDTASTNDISPWSAAGDPSRPSEATPTKGDPELAAVLRQLGTQTNLVQQVQAEHLGAAGPEARNKYRQLLGGLLSGKLTVQDIRVEAKSAADQLRELRQELGPEAGDTLDSYLAILDNFLQEAAPATGTVQNAAVTLPKPKPAATRKEE